MFSFIWAIIIWIVIFVWLYITYRENKRDQKRLKELNAHIKYLKQDILQKTKGIETKWKG